MWWQLKDINNTIELRPWQCPKYPYSLLLSVKLHHFAFSVAFLFRKINTLPCILSEIKKSYFAGWSYTLIVDLTNLMPRRANVLGGVSASRVFRYELQLHVDLSKEVLILRLENQSLKHYRSDNVRSLLKFLVKNVLDLYWLYTYVVIKLDW